MLQGEKILVTGAAGVIGFPICRELVKHNSVYGLARFTDAKTRAELEAIGVKTIQKDLANPDLSDVPDDFTYVFHAGAPLSPASEDNPAYTFEVITQGTGRVMHHCRHVKGFVHCSTASAYAYQGHRPLKESDIYGIHVHNYSLAKVAAEAVVSFASQQWGIPTVMLRIFTAYGPRGGAPAWRLDLMVQGKEIPLHPDKPNHFQPFYETDYVELGIKALTLGQVPPLVTNFAGPELTSVEEYMAYLGKLLDMKPNIVYTPTAYTSQIPDITYMEQVFGKPKVGWRQGMLRMVQGRYPERKLHPSSK